MAKKKNRTIAIAAALLVGCCAAASLIIASSAKSVAGAEPRGGFEVDIVVPKVVTNARGTEPGAAPAEGEACTTGCSLAKHAIPDFTEEMFAEALASYATSAATETSEALDTLLFYNKRTTELLDTLGHGPLSEDHVSFLRSELARDQAVVSIRMVDENGVVRVSYGPEKVSLGKKQHLAPSETGNLFAMEFNGTVMRTGLNYLWSRY